MRSLVVIVLVVLLHSPNIYAEDPIILDLLALTQTKLSQVLEQLQGHPASRAASISHAIHSANNARHGLIGITRRAKDIPNIFLADDVQQILKVLVNRANTIAQAGDPNSIATTLPMVQEKLIEAIHLLENVRHAKKLDLDSLIFQRLLSIRNELQKFSDLINKGNPDFENEVANMEQRFRVFRHILNVIKDATPSMRIQAHLLMVENALKLEGEDTTKPPPTPSEAFSDHVQAAIQAERAISRLMISLVTPQTCYKFWTTN